MGEEDEELFDDVPPKNSSRIRIRYSRTEAAVEDQAPASLDRQFFSGTDDGELAVGDRDGGNCDRDEEGFAGGGGSSRRTDACRANLACPECGKRFPSDKSLFGHLRCHPERDYRGANPPPPEARKKPSAQLGATRSFAARALPETAKWPTARRGRKLTAAATATYNDPVAKNAASILLLLADSKPTTRFDAADDQLDRFHVDGDEDYCRNESISSYRRFKKLKMNESSPPSIRSRKIYHCSLCLKVFTTHQALGGHRASHNKHKSIAAEEAPPPPPPPPPPKDEMIDEGGAAVAMIKAAAAVAEHRCRVCNMAFATGQALGGHQRRHFNEQLSIGRTPSSTASVQSSESGEKAAVIEGPSSFLQYSSEHKGGGINGFFDFDLNEVPRLE